MHLPRTVLLAIASFPVLSIATFDILHDGYMYGNGEGAFYSHQEIAALSGDPCHAWPLSGTSSYSNTFLSDLCSSSAYFGGSQGTVVLRNCGNRGGTGSYYATAYSSWGTSGDCLWSSQANWAYSCYWATSHEFTLQLTCYGDFGKIGLKARALDGTGEIDEEALTAENLRMANHYADLGQNNTASAESG